MVGTMDINYPNRRQSASIAAERFNNCPLHFDQSFTFSFPLLWLWDSVSLCFRFWGDLANNLPLLTSLFSLFSSS